MTPQQYYEIRSQQIKDSEQYSDVKPSKTFDVYWIYALNKRTEYPEHTDNGGKWLIFVDIEYIDESWQKVKLAVESGLLGFSAKVATAKANKNSTNSRQKVICVYTYDSDDESDVYRIREVLRDLGFTNSIPYKTDHKTRNKVYQNTGHKRISKYYG